MTPFSDSFKVQWAKKFGRYINIIFVMCFKNDPAFRRFLLFAFFLKIIQMRSLFLDCCCCRTRVKTEGNENQMSRQKSLPASFFFDTGSFLGWIILRFFAPLIAGSFNQSKRRSYKCERVVKTTLTLLTNIPVNFVV